MKKYTVVDSVMGSGKSTWAINYMDKIKNKNFIYVTPFLDEVNRVISSTMRKIVQPEHRGVGKLNNLYELLERQEDIATTHELFKYLDDKAIELIRKGNYILILDEVLDVINPIPMKKDDVRLLKEAGCIEIFDSGLVEWLDNKEDYDTRFNDIRDLALNHRLMCLDETFMLWHYGVEAFEAFDKVYVLTYMFESSLMYYYFKMHEIEYDIRSVGHICSDLFLTEYKNPDKTQYRKLIDIYEGNMNTNFHPKEGSLSKNWFRLSRNKEDIKQIKNNLYNFLRNQNKAKADDILWTTFKEYAPKIHGAGFKYKEGENVLAEEKTFLPFNSRATNDFSSRGVIGYCINIYMHPTIVKFFSHKGIKVNQEQYALSAMLQFIWRSRIRKGQQVILYIPSERMRKLLYKWLDVDAPAKKTIGSA